MEDLKFTGYNAHQGDVQFFEMSELPKNVKKQEKRFFAASEKSGHVHAMSGEYELFTDDSDNMYVRVYGEGAVVNHTLKTNTEIKGFWDKKDFLKVADHTQLFFKQGIFRVGIQKKYNPFVGVWESVRD